MGMIRVQSESMEDGSEQVEPMTGQKERAMEEGLRKQEGLSYGGAGGKKHGGIDELVDGLGLPRQPSTAP
eukprot:1291578-Pyramimonas_sp.AAC.1